ncbi:MAG TPA: spore protease YyaC [Bacillota bacterium]|jgi:putative sporulation protein YyaC|nr:spore protease YyaC [Bacillota bacterium]HOL09071.1 spore protease YyaC [Bacillota bacterium]HPO96746.1 spore protease YyaC [Bacillota bacterium]
MWNPSIKSKTNQNSTLELNSRVHVEQSAAIKIFQANLELFLNQLYDNYSDIIILCIGTDRSTGDSLGPLVGTKLHQLGLKKEMVYGTLDEPVHAVNLQETINQINQTYKNPFIIAIDACLGRSESVGYISIKEGPLQPGTGVNKDLPAVGDLQIIGIVNIGGFMEYMVLQNTRLSLVMKMAEIISRGIYNSINKSVNTVPVIDELIPHYEPVHHN